jgi:hypothetical protein
MSLTFDQIVSVLKSELTREELDRGVAYLSDTAMSAGKKLDFAGTSIEVPWEANLGFIDQEPMANWGHSCRYILIDRNTGQALSFSARFPPFSAGMDLHWNVVHRAKGVPDSVIAVKQ